MVRNTIDDSPSDDNEEIVNDVALHFLRDPETGQGPEQALRVALTAQLAPTEQKEKPLSIGSPHVASKCRSALNTCSFLWTQAKANMKFLER